MIRRSPETDLSIYVPKKDLEEPIIESEHETLWGGWIRIANGWCLTFQKWRPIRSCDNRQCAQMRWR